MRIRTFAGLCLTALALAACGHNYGSGSYQGFRPTSEPVRVSHDYYLPLEADPGALAASLKLPDGARMYCVPVNGSMTTKVCRAQVETGVRYESRTNYYRYR
ncbi:MAG TPA: hypothetical protein VHO23_00040 [Candidatus Paceibacterota bacterium]|nr:hypothetical protein [Candidatus Paceibacterota bacterium]